MRHEAEYYQYELISPCVSSMDARKRYHILTSRPTAQALARDGRLPSSEARLPIQQKDTGRLQLTRREFPRTFSPRDCNASTRVVTGFSKTRRSPRYDPAQGAR